ncbi:hypothetical protein BDF19DRAFT_436916 [Syncephalis fuscata]|nr:hypothetical protein BDF19DRAFT_436916 [Syncephalis fuscata]
MLEYLYDNQSASAAIEAKYKAAGDDEISALDIAAISHPVTWEQHRQHRQQSYTSSVSHRLQAIRSWVQQRLLQPSTWSTTNTATITTHRSHYPYPHRAEATHHQVTTEVENAMEHLQANEQKNSTIDDFTLTESTTADNRQRRHQYKIRSKL